MGYITKKENLVLCTDLWEGVGAVIDIIHNFASDLQRVHTPSRTAEQVTAIRRIPDKRGRKNEEMYVDVFGFCILHSKTLFVPTETTCSWLFVISGVCWNEALIVLCLSPGGFLNVYPADAHRGPDFSVNTEPDDGVSSTLQPLL